MFLRQVKILILIPMNTSITKEKIWSLKCWFTKKIFFISAACSTPRRQLCDRKSRRNLNQILKYFQPVYQGLRWVRIMKKVEVENLVWHTPCHSASLACPLAVSMPACQSACLPLLRLPACLSKSLPAYYGVCLPEWLPVTVSLVACILSLSLTACLSVDLYQFRMLCASTHTPPYTYSV